jgi:hypothetical protein
LEPDALLKVLDVSLDLKGIVRLVESPHFHPSTYKKYVLFDGSISAITILASDPEQFTAELEVVNGEWEGTEQIHLYRAFVYVQGPEYASVLSSTIQLNDAVIIVGSIEEVYTDEQGNRYPILLAVAIRKIRG